MSTKYDEGNSVSFNTVKFNGIGDFIAGTLVAVNQSTKKNDSGKFPMIYTIKADEGSFLGTTKSEKTGKEVVNETPTIINADEEWTFFGTGVMVDMMKKVKLGQKIMVKLTEFKDTGKKEPAKIKKVILGKDKNNKDVMDTEWLEAQKESASYSESEADEDLKNF